MISKTTNQPPPRLGDALTMKTPLRWFTPAALAIGSMAAALALVPVPARSAEVRDDARMFSAPAVRQAQATLDAFEKSTGLPVRIETVASLKEATTPREKSEWSRRSAREVVTLLAERKDRERGGRELYVLLARDDKVISNPLVPSKFASTLTESRRSAIREAFVNGMKTGDPDRALRDASLVIERSSAEMARAGTVGAAPGNSSFLPGPNSRPANAPAQVPGTTPRLPAPGAPQPVPGPSTGFSFFSLILLIGGVWLVFRLIRGLMGMGRSQAPYGGHGPGQGQAGPGPGYGYGPGPQQGGGGIFSSILGGLGGAIAGNWVYDQFRGHGGGQAHAGQTPFFPTSDPNAAHDPGGIAGGDDQGGLGGSWGSGSDSPGGWLDGGSSGGGDWGGGGGDFGGGGSDW
jgi:uncharacterized protein